MVQLRIAPGETNERLLDVSELSSADWAKTHTGISDYRITAPYDQSLEDDALEEVYLEEDDGTLLFRGLIESVSSDERGASTTVAGPGPAYKLESSEVVFTVQNQLAHNAIADFWNNETVFTPTVTQPSVQNTTTDDTALDVSTTNEFADNITIPDDIPLAVQNGEIVALQTNQLRDATNPDSGTSTTVGGATGFVDEQFERIRESGEFVEYEVTFPYDIPREHFGLAWRADAGGTEEFVTFNVTVNQQGPELSLDGIDIDPAFWDNRVNFGSDYLRAGFSKGQTVAIRFEWVADGNLQLDLVAPYDTRYSYNFDNSTDANFQLSGPELYPDAVDAELDPAATSWNVTEGTASGTYNDTSNSQRLQLRLGEQTYFPNDGTENNTSSVTTTFGSEVGNTIQARTTLSRYGSRTADTPTTGFNGQALQALTITYDGNDIPVIGDETFEGNQLEVAQDLHNRADMRYVVEHSKTSLPVYSFRAGDETRTLPATVLDDENNRTTRSDFGEYFNDVTVRGQTEGDTRLKASVEDSSEITTYGRRHFDAVDPSLKTEAQLEAAARALLLEKLRERDKKGRIRHPPVDVQPGFSYSNPFGSGTIPIEEVRYLISNGQIEGESVFDFRTDLQLGESFGGLRRSDRNTKLGF
jgi:hypothetical protein